MKPIRDQETTRRHYHLDATSNTVHRSSLVVPSMTGAKTDISFANHFLFKRGYRDVACRLTSVDSEGRRADSRTIQVTEPRVYAIELDEFLPGRAESYLVEFFSAANLFYPFPAVMVNHRNDRFINSVHSYNRVLNDVFEDDEINARWVREASIDVRIDQNTDTFAVFTSGPNPCRGELEVSLRAAGETIERRVPLDLPRLCNREISMRGLFGEEAAPQGGVLTIQQPHQRLFYGRMLAGRRCLPDRAFGANHSFYDCSSLEEYWDDGSPSSRVYPLLDDLAARIRLYPIYSPSRLVCSLELLDADARVVKRVDCEPLRSPSSDCLDFSVTDAIVREGLHESASFRFIAQPERGPTPRRINHQVVYEDPAGRSPLAASVAISLKNPNAFVAEGKQGLTWGQCALSADLDSRFGMVLDGADGETESVDLRLIGEHGEVMRKRIDLIAGAAYTVDPAALAPELVASNGERPHYLWYWATCRRPDLSAYSVSRHRVSGHCSGEHSF